MQFIEAKFPIEPLNQICKREGKARRPIYQVHKWWARRLGSAFRMILLTTFADESVTLGEIWDRFYGGWSPKFPLEGKVILDPFMGGGVTAVEALRLGCRVLGIDLNPVAWFITKKQLEPVDIPTLDRHFLEIERRVKDKILSLYRTRCPEGHRADVMYIIWVNTVECVNCGEKVKLRDTKNGKFECPSCGQGDEVTRWVEQFGRPPEMEMEEIEYWCPSCRERGWKKPDEDDFELYRKACRLFEEEKDKLPIPDAEIPRGVETDRLPRRGYKRFRDLFNPRQLLCLGWLYREILKIEDEKVQELFILAFSEALRYNCAILGRHNEDKKGIEPAIEGNYWPPESSGENNVWGAKVGWGTFANCYKKVKKAIEWLQKPWELGQNPGQKRYTNDPPRIRFGTPEDVLLGRATIWLDARTAEDLSFLPDKSIDAVITDPPYYGNRHYGELADFFYVWLRIALRTRYPQFAPPLSPKAREIEVNEVVGKDDDFFIQGLTQVFRECHRVLKPEGLMAFTFHHAEAEAWAAVLKAILDAGFDIRAVWPYHSEAAGGWVRAWGIDFDMIVVCRKREGIRREVSWESLKDRIALEAEREIKALLDSGMGLSDVDMFIVTMGKAIALYSQHWPKVLREGREVSLGEAVREIEEEVDFKLDEIVLGRGIPETLDTVSRAYLQHLAHRPEVTVTYLRKVSQWRGIEQEDWLRGYYIERTKGGFFRVVRPERRYEHLKHLWEEGGLSRMIDIAHYLYGLDTEGRPVPDIFRGNPKLIEVLNFLSRVTKDKKASERYRKLAEILQQLK